MFDLDTGKLKANSIGGGAWRNMNPSPKGTWRRVRVDARGFVREGLDEDIITTARLFRAVFDESQGKVETPRSFTTLTPTVTYSTTNIYDEWFTYRWVVPEGVTRIRALLASSGEGYDEDGSNPGTDGRVIEFAWTVVPGERLRVKIGKGPPPDQSASVRGIRDTFLESDDATRKVWTAGGVSISQLPAASVVGNYRTHRTVGSYGRGGQATTEPGQSGLAVLEWYA